MESKLKIIPGYTKYLISTKGEIFRKFKTAKKQLKTSLRKDGYVGVELINNNKKRKYCRVHRLVALTFIPNPHKKQQVNHIDCNKQNNTVHNLEWVTPQENVLHFREKAIKGLHPFVKPSKLKLQTNMSKKIICLNYAGEYLYTFESLTDVKKITGIDDSQVSKVCRGLLLSAGGYKWRYEKTPIKDCLIQN